MPRAGERETSGVLASARASASRLRVASVVRPHARDSHVFLSKEAFRFP